MMMLVQRLAMPLENALQLQPAEVGLGAGAAGQPVDIDCEMGQVDIKPKEELSQK